jgi:Aldehyde dehydrogenase family
MADIDDLATVAPATAVAEIGPQLHFIDGEFVPSRDGSTFTTLDPTTNAPLVEVADGKSADIDAAVAAARRAFDDGPWPRLSAAKRARVLRRIADTIRAHARELIELEVRDIGMPISQMHGLAARAAQNFDYWAADARPPGDDARHAAEGPVRSDAGAGRGARGAAGPRPRGRARRAGLHLSPRRARGARRARHRVDARRRPRAGQLRPRPAVPRRPGCGDPMRRGVGRLPARAGDAVPGAGRRLLRRAGAPARFGGRARRGRRGAGGRRRERGCRPRGGVRAARATRGSRSSTST